MICEECCEKYDETTKCSCKGGETNSKKFLGLVKGCVVFEKNIRCKKECYQDYDICSEHFISCPDTRSIIEFILRNTTQ
jgi:hypothetical protein